MRRYLVPILAALGLALPTVVVTASPASATYTLAISAIDVSTPGHAKGTVATDAPYVAVQMDPGWYDPAFPQIVIPVLDGVASLDLETWGIRDPEWTVIHAQACASEVLSSCEPGSTSAEFYAKDVYPSVIWPESSNASGSAPFLVGLSDPDGGGLVVLDNWTSRTTLSHGNLTSLELPPSEGWSGYYVYRCSSVVDDLCRRFDGLSFAAYVNREFTAAGEVGIDSKIMSPAGGDKLLAFFGVDTELPMTLDWHLVTASGGSSVPGIGGQVTDLTGELGGYTGVELDVPGLVDGNYLLAGAVSYQDPEDGLVTAPLTGGTYLSFTADSTAPPILSIEKSTNTLAPYQDGYLDKIEVLVDAGGTAGVTAWAEVINAKGNAVDRVDATKPDGNFRFVWNGTGMPGTWDAGLFTMNLFFQDKAGNVSQEAVTFQAVRKKLVERRLTKEVSAAGSLVDAHVGRCSTLAKNARSWSGSLGLYTNVKCNAGFKAGLVQTFHSTRLPKARSYESFQMGVWSGAARSQPGSLAYIGYINRDGNLVADSRLGYRTGRYVGEFKNPAKPFIWDGRRVFWSTYTAEGSRYEIRDFTVWVYYTTLVDY